MKQWSPQHYRAEGIYQEVDTEILKNSLAYAKRIIAKNNNIVPIFTLNHLSYLADVEYSFLRSIIKREINDKSYRFFFIKKKNSSNRRRIFVPHSQLLKVQKYIHNNILKYIPVHECSYAYVSNTSVLDAAKNHTNSRWLIKLDITNFFESINEISVYKVFRSLEFPALLSFELTRICTWNGPRNPQIISKRFKIFNEKNYKIYPVTLELGHLPQGAPTSPCLSNLVCRELDKVLFLLATNKGLEYTRYSDDITFSYKGNDFSRKQATKIIHEVYTMLLNFGFSPNKNKTKIISPRSKRIVLGLNVDRNQVNLDKKMKNKIKQHIYFCLKNDVGPIQHAKHKNFSSVLGFKNHLHGLIMYASSIDKDFGQKMLDDFNKINWVII